jgi:hypothetical protein
MKKITRRRGVTAVLAMLYLTLFASLAVGFYAATNISTIVSHNEQRANSAAISAESGMAFMRYQLSRIAIPHGTPNDQLFAQVYTQLGTNLDSTANLGATGIDLINDTIQVPAGTTHYITLDSSGSKFRATVQDQGQGVLVTVYAHGSDPSLTRIVQMKYNLAQKASAIFDYGVASKGQITTSGAAQIVGATDPTKGSLLSTCMTVAQPVIAFGKVISGDISISNPDGDIPYGASTTIGGESDPDLIDQHIHKGVPPPAFPTVDTSAYAAYVNSTYDGSMSTLVNCRIPANSNITLSNVTIKGVLYLETPCKLKFNGNTTIQGCIVVQNNPTGTIATNTLTFNGNVSATGVETLDASFGDLRKLTGAFLLAPNFFTSFSGNFGSVSGSILSSKISMTGNATGTVKGTIVGLDNNPMLISGSSDIIIASTGTTNFPAGVFFDSTYVALMDTYEEIKP